MKTKILTALFIGAVLLYCAPIARAQSVNSAARTLSYQGVLRTADGRAAQDSNYRITVKLYGDEAGTRVIWEDTYEAHTTAGIFNLGLGSGNNAFPEASELDHPMWVGVQVDGNAEMRPLAPLSASAYALNVADKSISASKISADYVKSVTLNGQTISGNGKELNIETGDGIQASVDKATNSIVLKSEPASLHGVKGGDIQGNTTISGALTVTGASNLQGNVVIGSSSSNTLAVNGRVTTSVIPQLDNAVDLGDANHYWNEAYIEHITIGPHSLTMVNGDVETQMTMPTQNNPTFQFNVMDISHPLTPVLLSNPMSFDQFGMTTTDLRSDAITSGNSIKIDGTSNPRFIQGDQDMKIFVDPVLDGGTNPVGAVGKTLTIYAGPGGALSGLTEAGNGGTLTLASGKKGNGAVNAIDGTIFFKTGGPTGTTQMFIDPTGVTINSALFTTGTFTSSTVTPVIYGGTAQGSTLSLLTTSNTSAPTGSITLGGSTGAGTATFATMNATSVNLGSGISLRTNGTTRISSSGAATFTTLTTGGTALINTTSSDGNTSIGNASNTVGVTASTITATGALTTHGAALVNTTASDGNTSIGNASNTVGVTASTITTTGAVIANGTLTTHGAALVNTTASDGNTSIGNASNTVGVTASTITATGALTTHGAALVNTTASDGNTSIGNASNTVGVTASTITATGALTTHGAALVNTTASDGATTIGNASNTTDLHASATTINTASGDGTTAIGYAGHTLAAHGNASLNGTASDGTTLIGNASNTTDLHASATTINTASGDGTTAIGYAGHTLAAHGNASLNGTASDGTTLIGNASNTTDLHASATTINTASGDGTTAIGYAGHTLAAHGNASLNGTASDGTTLIGNASNTTDLHASATTINTASGDGTTAIGYAGHTLAAHGNASLNGTASDGTTLIGNASNTTDLHASATTINTASGDGTTAIGYAGHTLAMHGNATLNTTASDGTTAIGNASNTTTIVGNNWSIPTSGQALFSSTVINNGGTDNAISIPAGFQYVVVSGCDTTTGSDHQVTLDAPTGQLGQTMYIFNANHWNGSNDGIYLVLGSNFAGYQVAGGFTISPGYGNMFMWIGDDGTGTAGWVYIGL